MKTARIVALASLVSTGTLAGVRPANAITTPDVNSQACTSANGNQGCFKITNQHSTTQTSSDSSANGTAITAVAAGNETAVKAFTDGNSLGSAVFALSTGAAIGLKASSSSGSGITTSSGSGAGITASSTSGTGVDAFSAANSGTAVSGRITGVGTGARGVYGEALNGVGVYGSTTGTGFVSTAAGVYGTSPNGSGVYGTGTFYGVQGFSASSTGVYGHSTDGVGLTGTSNSYFGITASSQTAPAIYSSNNVTTIQNPPLAVIHAVPGSTSALAFWGGGGIQLTGSFAEKVGGGAWSAPSDKRIKKDVKDLDRGLLDLMRVRPVTFKYNGLGGTEDDGKEYVGVIAQELETVMPSMVSSRMGKLRTGDAQNTKIKIVDPSAFTYLLINAVKQQQRTIEKQEARIADLERSSAPVAASVLPAGLGAWPALALLPIGLLIGRRRRN